MIDTKKINELVQNLLEALPPGVSNIPKDLAQNFQTILQSAFTKLDLVTREEFDAQTKVLQRTREKLDHLEKEWQHLK